MKKLTAIDLFSGCGGLTIGLKQAGFDVIAAVEIEPLAVETYRMNHASTVVWQKDIRLVGVQEVKVALGLNSGQLDLLAGCPPCEGFSALRTRNGGNQVDDDRNELIFEFLRFIRGLRPKAIMVENVPRLVMDHRMTKFRRELHKLGYQISLDVFNAADFGVPQRRRRMILLASQIKKPEFADTVLKKTTVFQAIHNLPHPRTSKDPLHNYSSNRSERIKKLIRSIPKNGGSRSALEPASQLACHQQCDGFKDVYGRIAWHDVAPTITSGCINPSKGRFLHPRQDRPLSLREAAILQTFPRNYKFSLRRGRYAVASMIGDALPPRFIYHQARSLATQLTVGR